MCVAITRLFVYIQSSKRADIPIIFINIAVVHWMQLRNKFLRARTQMSLWYGNSSHHIYIYIHTKLLSNQYGWRGERGKTTRRVCPGWRRLEPLLLITHTITESTNCIPIGKLRVSIFGVFKRSWQSFCHRRCARCARVRLGLILNLRVVNIQAHTDVCCNNRWRWDGRQERFQFEFSNSAVWQES